MSDFAYVESTKKLYAAVAQGGVWESSDLGDNWKSIGDNLPIQSTGAIAWTLQLVLFVLVVQQTINAIEGWALRYRAVSERAI